MSHAAGRSSALQRFVALAAVAGVGSWLACAHATPVSFCRETLRGNFKATDGRVMPVALRLTVRNDLGDLSLLGRFRCTAKRDLERCFLGPAYVTSYGLQTSANRLLAQTDTHAALSRAGPYRVVCALTASTPFVRDMCVPALGGTFACVAEGDFGSVSGAFGLAADGCRPCLFH